MTAVLSAYSSRRWLVLALDVVLVIVFAIAGRASHAETLTATGIAGTAWPFVVACLVGWVIITLLPAPFALVWPSGLVVWIVTVAGGLGLRVLAGDTAAVPFVVVATLVLAVFLLLPRAALGRRRFAPGTARSASSRTTA